MSTTALDQALIADDVQRQVERAELLDDADQPLGLRGQAGDNERGRQDGGGGVAAW